MKPPLEIIKGTHQLRGTFIEFNKPDVNGKWHSRELWLDLMCRKFNIYGTITNGIHVLNDPKKYSHHTCCFKFTDDKLIGTITPLPEFPVGRILWDLIDNNIPIWTSYVIEGELEIINGKNTITKGTLGCFHVTYNLKRSNYEL